MARRKHRRTGRRTAQPQVVHPEAAGDEVCALRTLLRHRDTLVKAAARSVLHMQKSYDQMNIHVHHAISDLTGVTGMAITDAILDGERDPARLVALADRRIKASRDTLIKALQGDWRPEHLFTLQQARQTYAHYQQLIDTCDRQIQGAIRALRRPPEAPADAPSASAGGAGAAAGEGEPPSSPSTPEPEPFVLSVHLTRLFGTDLTLIPGIGESTALTLFAEIGADMSRFPDAAHFASWLNLCPQNKITGGRVISSKTGPASNRAAQALRMATQSLYRSQTSLGEYFRRKRARLGTPQAITASAHKMARIIYHLVTHHALYDDDVLSRQQHRDHKRRERTICATKPVLSVSIWSHRQPDYVFLRR